MYKVRAAWKHTHFHVPIKAICQATSIHTKRFITPKTSRHLYCWPDSQASRKRCSEMCSSASCLTGTPDLLRIPDFSLSGLELISSTCISAKQRLRKRVLYKIHGLTEGAVNCKARNTHCLLFIVLFSSNILLLNLATNHSTCKGYKLFLLLYKWINVDCTRVFLQYQTWNPVLTQKKKDSPSPAFTIMCQIHILDYSAWNHSSKQVHLLKIGRESRKSNARSNAIFEIVVFLAKTATNCFCYVSRYPLTQSRELCWELTKGPCFKPSCNPLAWGLKVAYLLWQPIAKAGFLS